jgi:hypothetical protein
MTAERTPAEVRCNVELGPDERAKLDALLDHIYEYGTTAEGVLRLAAQLCQAARAAERERWHGQHTDSLLAVIAAQDAELTQLRAELAAERERCAMKLQVTRADVSLAAGELTAQEWRTCAAVLRWMQARIRA